MIKPRINWLAIFGWMILPFLIWMIYATVIPPVQAAIRTCVVLVFFGSIVWFNLAFVIPKFLESRRFAEYAFFALVPAIVLAVIRVFIEDSLGIELRPLLTQVAEFNHKRYTFFIVVNHLIAAGMALLYHFFTKWSAANHRESLLKSEKLEAELNFLKGQVSPHFLFNTLNNIYTLCYLKDDKAPEMVLKLSAMMRYLIDEGSKKKVPLTNEVTFLESYLELQKLKSSGFQKITMTSSGITSDTRIAPLLLLPFFENIFKHSDLESNSNGYASVSIVLESGGILVVRITNSRSQHVAATMSSGFGVKNAHQRLSLIYGGTSKLTITDEPGSFSVNLIINLK